MNESDLLLVVGASFADHTGIAPHKPIVQVDDAPSAIGRFHPVDVGALGDAAVTLRTVIESLGDAVAVDQRPDAAARWAIWRAEKARRAADDRGRGLASAAVFAAVGALPAFLHYGASNEQLSGHLRTDATHWHNWAVEWTPARITTSLDGVPWWTTTATAAFPPGPMHMTVQLDWFPTGGATVPSQMQVDRVSYYPLPG